MTSNTEFFHNWSWPRLLEVLSEDDNPGALAEATRFLRRLQKVAFSELRKELEENVENLTTSWDQPFLIIRVDLEGRISRTHSAGTERVEFEPSDPPAAAIFDILTAGASKISQGDQLYPFIPEPLAVALAPLSDESKRHFFDQWMQPISYGDEVANDGAVIGRSSHGEAFRAGLTFRIYPRVFEPESEQIYHDLEVGLPWMGNSDPEKWTAGERDALWAVIFRCLDELIAQADSGQDLSEILSQRVPTQPPPRRAFHSFDIVLKPDNKRKPFSEIASARRLQETALRAVFPNGPEPHDQGPVLEVTDGQGELKPNAFLDVILLMTYPDSVEARNAHRLAIEDVSLSAAMSGVDVDALPEFLHDRPFILDLSEKSAKSGFGGAFAGDLLLFLLNVAEHEPDKATVLRALRVIQSDYRNGQNHAGQPLQAGRSTLFNAWSKFKPVAHLWAAFRLWQSGSTQADVSFAPISEEDDGGEGLLNFLSIAMELRRRAETFTVRGQKSPLLDPAVTWRTPPDLKLGEARFTIPDLTEWAKEQLAEYRAR